MESNGRAVAKEESGAPVADGREALERWAPDSAAVTRSLEAAAWRAMDEAGIVDLLELAARVAAGQHGLIPLERPSQYGGSRWRDEQAVDWRGLGSLAEADRAALRFAEQLAFDVSSLPEEQRTALFGGLGEAAAPFAQAVYVADFLPRARHALDALFGASDWSGYGEGTPEGTGLQQAIDDLIRVVPGLQALDPVTTELVRLLGARRHRCRICQSLRSRSALVAGADDAMFDAVDHYATSDLAPAHKAALAFTEAIVAAPGSIDADLGAALRAHHPPEACVELVLDVLRNACNKVAVALAADAARVDEGYEIYDVTPEGELLYDLEAP